MAVDPAGLIEEGSGCKPTEGPGAGWRPWARRLRWLALAGLLLGTLLFAGSLAGGALLGWPTRLAPLGGTVLMASWLLLAADALRR